MSGFVSTEYQRQASIQTDKSGIERLQRAIEQVLGEHARLSGVPRAPMTVALVNGTHETVATLRDDGKYQERTHQHLGEVLGIIAAHYPKAKEVLDAVRARSGTRIGELVTVDNDLIAALENVVGQGQLRGFTREEMVEKCRLEGIALHDVKLALAGVPGADALNPQDIRDLVSAQVTGTEASLARYRGLKDSITEIVTRQVEAIKRGERPVVGTLQGEVRAALRTAGITETADIMTRFTSGDSPVLKAITDYAAAEAARRAAIGGNPAELARATVAAGRAAAGLRDVMSGLPESLVTALNTQIRADRDVPTRGTGIELELELVKACDKPRPVGVTVEARGAPNL